MKRIIYIISLLALFTSCNYLDVKPVGSNSGKSNGIQSLDNFWLYGGVWL